MRRFLSVFAGLSLVLASAMPAFAHAHLGSSTPAVDSSTAFSQEVSITFSEALEPKVSSIAVVDVTGSRVDRGDLHVVQGDAHVVAIGLNTLLPGVYSVEWHATSIDTS